MKRKRWSEVEEVTLLNKYSDLQTSGTLAKLKTREKKFKPIAEHVNSVHHLHDPVNFPFKWSWRDVSIKVQNMRHQYLGVKQKIRVPNTTDEFNWEDGDDHWENFMKYKQVFGDIELECNYNNSSNKRCIDDVFEDSEFLGFDESGNNNDDDYDVDVDDEKNESNNDYSDAKKLRKRIGGRMLGLVSAQVLELRDVAITREDKRREREWRREECSLENTADGNDGVRELELLEERREFDDERLRWRMEVEERWEEEEMKWREKMVSMQMEHEKQMMELHANACHNQMQILGVMARFFSQFFGSAAGANDGLLGTLVSQHHSVSGGLDDNGKPDANSPSEFF